MYGYKSWTIEKTECQIIEFFFFFNGAGKDSLESLGHQGDQTSHS